MRKDRDADARRHQHFVLCEQHRLGDFTHDAVGNDAGPVAPVDLRQKHHELIAAEPRQVLLVVQAPEHPATDRAAGTKNFAQARSDHAQHLVAHPMTQGVVDAFEIIQIDT